MNNPVAPLHAIVPFGHRPLGKPPRGARWLRRAAPAAVLLVACATSAQTAGPEGRVPNRSYPRSEVLTQISPQMGDRHHNQPTVVNGYLLLAGNGEHEFWDISDPYAPVRLSELFSPHRSGDAESHQVSYARFPDGSLYLATTSGRGIDLWAIDDVRAPRLLSALELPNVHYGDLHGAVWGIAWQGDYIYVGATSDGIHIVDAADPTRPYLVATVPTSETGGVAAGALFALGNLLVVTTPKKLHGGVVTMDIGDPAHPRLLDFVVPRAEGSYLGSFYGRYAYLQFPLRAFDVTTDPRNIRLVGSANNARTEYLSFADGYAFVGGTRRVNPGIWKYSLADPAKPRLVSRIPARDARWDDQFSIAIGNLIAISDDQYVNGYVGSFLAVHARQPDTRPPVVDYVNPPDGAVDQPTSSRIGLSFSDQIELASVDGATLAVRPVGGEALTGTWGHTQTVVSFWPDAPLLPDTEYEIVAAAGGITDLVGNALAREFRSGFRTGAESAGAAGGIEALAAAQTGRDAHFAARPTPGLHAYRWDFGDGRGASGASVSHVYDTPGRYTVTLSVARPDGWDAFQAEDGTLSEGVAVANERGRYFGSGYAAYRGDSGSNATVEWQIPRDASAEVDIVVRYSNDSGDDLPLRLIVNGRTVGTVAFGHTGGWGRWRLLTIDGVELDAGTNTVKLTAPDGAGPHVDQLSVPSETATEVALYSAVQIVHRSPAGNRPARSGTVVVAADGVRAWAVNPDADTVTAVGTAALSRAFESRVGRTPRTLAQAPDGTIWVVNEGSHDISVLDPGDGAVVDTIELPPASMPYGIAFAPDGRAAYVTLQALGRLLRIDPVRRSVVHSLALGPDADGVVPRPRGIAIGADGRRVLVARFVSPDTGGEIHDVEVLGETAYRVRTIALAVDPGPDTPESGRGLPNYLGAPAISPDGAQAWVPSKKDNIERGGARDGLALTHESTVRTAVSRIDLATGREDLGARIDLDDHDMASAVAFSPRGDLLFVAVQGSNRVVVVDARSGAQVAGIATGLAPQGLALDGRGRLYVQNFMGRSLSVFDVSALLAGTESSAKRLAEVDLVARETLSDEVLRGKRIFYDASSSRMSLEGYISCASCHLDGGQDGRTWDFTDRGEGLRNTISLHGRGGTGQGPLHWTGNFDEIQDFEHDIRSHFGGSGFMSDADFASGTRSDPLGDPKTDMSGELDALAAYVSSLAAVPPSPYRDAGGGLTAEGRLGRAVFADEGCDNCHGGAAFTDSAPGVLHDVGTLGPGSGGRVGRPLTGLDTPTLKGVWATAPYLHDGSAPTLARAVEAHRGVSLSGAELGALVAYLRQIDEREDGVCAGVAGGCADATLGTAPETGTIAANDNSAPEFAAPSARRSMAETVGGEPVRAAGDIGGRIAATDADGDALEYGLEGMHAERFEIDAATGQLRTKAGARYDHEDAARLAVTVTAADGHGATATIAVTVEVTDVAEAPLAPAAPAVRGAAQGATGLEVSWTAPDNTGRPPIAGYDVQYRTAAEASWTDGPLDVAGTVAGIAGLSAGTLYAVRVRAGNADGEGAWSGTGTGRTNVDDPSSKDIDADPKNLQPRGLWGDGDTLWVADYFDSRLYAYGLADGSRAASRDIVTAVGNNRNGARLPTGVWGNGETVWVADSDVDRVYAFRLQGGTRDAARDLALEPNAHRPSGLWSDGETMWVLDKDGRKVYAYAMSDGARDPARDFPLSAGTFNWGLWSDGDVFWTVDFMDRTAYAYRDGSRLAGADIALDRNAVPSGLWSDGVTVWVSEYEIGGLRAYALPWASRNASLVLLGLSGADLGPFSAAARAYSAAVPNGTAVATLTATPAAGAALAIDPPDADAAAHGHQVALVEGTNTVTVTVTAADGATAERYTVTVTRAPSNAAGASVEDGSAPGTVQDVDVSDDATLASLGLSGIDFGIFAAGTASYTATVGHDVASTQVTATANGADASITIADADGSTAGTMRTVALAEGSNTITVAVTAEDGATTQTYTVTVTREAAATPETAATPLTAAFGSVPGSHDGTNEFTVRLHFTEDIETGFRVLRDQALSATGGTVTESRRVNGRNDLWQIHVQPSGTAAVTVTLDPASDDCAETGSVCTSDGRALSNTPSVTVGGPALLTAAFVSAPAEHDGTSEFVVRLHFTEDIETRFRVLRDQALSATGGTVTGLQRINGRNDLWHVRVQPSGTAAVTVTLDPTTDDCAETGSVCTADGRALSNAPSVTVDGPSAVGASVNGIVVTLQWGSPRDDFGSPSVSDYGVRVNGAARAIVSAEVSGSRAWLTLESPVAAGDQVTVAYLGSAMHPLAEAGGRVRSEPWDGLAAENLTGAGPVAGAAASVEWRPADPLAAAPDDAVWLDASRLGLSELGGVERLSALERLDLSGNAVSDLSPLAGLENLRDLDLSGNRVTDLWPLAGLYNLERLNLSGNAVTDVQALAWLPNLTVLLLDGNEVADAWPLAGVAMLENLGLGGNRIGDVTALQDLQQLRRLDLSGNPVVDLSALGDIGTLVWVALPGDRVEASAETLGRLTRLGWVWFGSVETAGNDVPILR